MKMLTLFLLMVLGMVLVSYNSQASLYWNATFNDNSSVGDTMSCSISSCELNCEDGENAIIVHQLINMSLKPINNTIDFRIKFETTTANGDVIYYKVENNTDVVVERLRWKVRKPISGDMILRNPGNEDFTLTGITSDGTYHNLKFKNLPNNSVDVFVNNSYLGNHLFGSSAIIGNATYLLFRSSANFTIDYVAHYTDNDTIAPEINMSLNISNFQQNDVINISANISDDYGLSFCQFIINQSGSREYLNKSLNGQADKCSQNITITNNGVLVNITLRVNDTSNNFQQEERLILSGDTINPTLTACTLSSASITDTSGNTIDLSCNATDNGIISSMVFTINGSLNVSRSFSITQSSSVSSTYSIFSSSETLKVGSYSISQVNVTDTSNNKLSNVTNDLHFSVTSAPSGSTPSNGGGGGASTTTTISYLNGTPLLSFGIAELSFFVVTTPSESQKIIKFINMGNVSFTGGKIEIQGSIEPYIQASVCNLNVSNCKIRDIELKSGQNAFLVVDGNFTQKIESGVAGIIRLNGNKVFDLAVVADRPPLYNKAVLPFVKQGFSEPIAYVIGYSLTSLIVLGSLFFIKGIAA